MFHGDCIVGGSLEERIPVSLVGIATVRLLEILAELRALLPRGHGRETFLPESLCRIRGEILERLVIDIQGLGDAVDCVADMGGLGSSLRSIARSRAPSPGVVTWRSPVNICSW